MHRVLHQHPQRVLDPDRADLFYMPIYPYMSLRLGNCTPMGGDTAEAVSKPLLHSHQGRMEAVKASLAALPHFMRYGGRDHFWATTTWSNGKRQSFSHAMSPLGVTTSFVPSRVATRDSALVFAPSG